MLRNLFSRAVLFSADIVLLHSALSRSEVIFGDELRRYAAEGRLRLIELHTDTHGMLDVDDLDTIVPDIAERTTYACGPAGLLEALETTTPRRTAAALERFRSPVVVTGEGGTLTFGKTGTVVEATATSRSSTPPRRPACSCPAAAGWASASAACCRCGRGAVRDLRNGELTTARRVTAS